MALLITGDDRNNYKIVRAMTKIRLYIERRKYEILLISFLALIFGGVFLPSDCSGLVEETLPFQNMLVGLIVFFNKKNLRMVIMAFIIANILISILSHWITNIGHSDLHSLWGIVYLSYFIIVTIEVYRKIFTARFISAEMLSAVLCGFILLSLIGTFLFFQIETLSNHSFSNLHTVRGRMSDLSYFSFVTVLTIGYGDIVPLTPVAKEAVMFIGLAAHFYNVFVSGIFIGKYIIRTSHNPAPRKVQP
jgi:hypothetical protein